MRIPARTRRHVMIRQRHIRTRLINPFRQRLHKQAPRTRLRARSGPHLPIRLRPLVALVERNAVRRGF